MVNLILLHGWGGSGDTWDEVVGYLDVKAFRVIRPDLRGHGRSGCPAGSLSWGGLARDILAIANREQAQRFVPVGFSLGGKLACYLAAKHADRFPVQILVAPVPPGVVPIDREFGLQVCREAGDWRRNKNVFQNWFAPAAKADVVDAYSKTVAQTPRWVLEATAEMALWTSLTTEIGQLQLPSLMVTGEHDPIYHANFQTEHTRPHLTNVTDAPLNSGHFIPLECPRELAWVVSTFLAGKISS